MNKRGRKTAVSRPAPQRRSPCPVACGLDLIGDRWTLLIVRDLIFGRSRFKEFAASPEGIPTNVLSDRLLKLQANDLISLIPAPDGSKHPAYCLTEKGRELLPILRGLRQWASKWIKGTDAKMKP